MHSILTFVTNGASVGDLAPVKDGNPLCRNTETCHLPEEYEILTVLLVGVLCTVKYLSR